MSENHQINDQEHRLISVIQGGFPLISRPFLAIGQQIDLTENEVIATIDDLKKRGVIKRLGIIVRHRELGYHANAMVVWDIPESMVNTMGKRLGAFEFVSLCYQRRRSLPYWPYNLYCMIHGRERKEVLLKLENLESSCGLKDIDRQLLFSQRRFKQRGAHYFSNRTLKT